MAAGGRAARASPAPARPRRRPKLRVSAGAPWHMLYAVRWPCAPPASDAEMQRRGGRQPLPPTRGMDHMAPTARLSARTRAVPRRRRGRAAKRARGRATGGRGRSAARSPPRPPWPTTGRRRHRAPPSGPAVADAAPRRLRCRRFQNKRGPVRPVSRCCLKPRRAQACRACDFVAPRRRACPRPRPVGAAAAASTLRHPSPPAVPK